MSYFRGFIGISVLAVLLMSCSESSSKKNTRNLPDASGDLAQIVVIYDKAHSTDAFKDSIDAIFGLKIKGLPAGSEPMFKVMYSDETFFKGFFKRHHNMFVLLHSNNLQRLEKTYGDKNRARIEEIISGNDALGFSKKNVWANGQNVFYVTAKDEASLLNKMNERRDEIIEIARSNEMRSGRSKVFDVQKKHDKFYKSSLAKRGFTLRKPSSFRVAIDNDEFVWLRKESSKYDYGILMYEVPYSSRDQFKLDKILELRERYTKKYIPGEIEGNYMGISPYFVPDTTTINFKDRYTVLTQGWWRVVPDEHMAGPFMSYTVYDESKKRIVVVEGFVYGPNKSKAWPMREVETILNSLEIK